jgi:hypothetical protein
MRRVLRCVVPGLLAAVLGAGGGCGTTEVPVLLATGGGMDAGVVSVDAQAPPLDAPVDGSGIGTEQDYCKGSGPPALVATEDAGPVSKCPDQLAQAAFRYALCLCGNYVSDHALVTDAFDGSQGGPTKVIAGGSVGVNGDLHPGRMQIGGSLWASEATDITTTSPLQVAGELHAQGELHPSSTLVVQGDAWMAGGIQSTGDVTVGGTLHLPASAPDSVAGTFNHGTIDPTSFQVLPACDCNHDDFVDVAGVVRTYAAQNDDMALGILPDMLKNVQPDGGTADGGPAGVTLSLPCGRIFFSSIGGDAPIHLIAQQGRTAIFVQGDISTSEFRIDVPTGNELDLFVGGSITVSGAFQVGDTSNPARARTYVGGTVVNLQGAATLAGNLYAPAAAITLGTAPTTLYGSIFALQFSSQSDLTIHYDAAILTEPSSSRACATPMTCPTSADRSDPAAGCNECNGQACNSGLCGPCADSSQCCRPLVCDKPSGACVAAVIPR